jgi:exodeoxyribonuclease VII large subunit
LAPRIWQVGALCRAVADTLDARFNPVAVRGEVSGFSRAASGHCYFSIKDTQGQIRCAMFRRAASLLDFQPRDGELVEVRGRLGVYEQRGDLQLVVESMSRAGQGALFEQFLLLKKKLETEGLFDAARKRALPLMPRSIGLVTSLNAAALHDVATALARRLPHVPVVLSAAAVQGAGAAAEIVRALQALYAWNEAAATQPGVLPVDVILLVRGGGSMEDLWPFNDEQLARTLAASPVPVISGVGHETDFTIADFVADLRAPTPTAAAELVAAPRDTWLGALALIGERLSDAVTQGLDARAQRLDQAAARLGRPSARLASHRMALSEHGQRLHFRLMARLQQEKAGFAALADGFDGHARRSLQLAGERLRRADLRLTLLDPGLVLKRGYAWLADEQGQAITGARAIQAGQPVTATLADGEVDLTVNASRPN